MSVIQDKAAKTFAVTLFKAKKNSPHIFFGLGVVGIIGSAVLACRATLKLEETIDELREEVEDTNKKAIVHAEGVITPEIVERFEIAEQERAKQVSIITVKGVVAIGKLYGPAVVLGGVSIACLAGSHVQLTRRNAALTAAFSALTKAFDDYRSRVRAEVGEDKERDLYRALGMVEMQDENGKKQLVQSVDADGLSIYAKCFDETCEQWKPNAEFNRTFITAQEAYANHALRRDGLVFLNDVYKALGFERTSLGAIVGWIKDSENGDNYIDFGMFQARNRRHMNALEPSIWLDFNVDGVIWDKIP